MEFGYFVGGVFGFIWLEFSCWWFLLFGFGLDFLLWFFVGFFLLFWWFWLVVFWGFLVCFGSGHRILLNLSTFE